MNLHQAKLEIFLWMTAKSDKSPTSSSSWSPSGKSFFFLTLLSLFQLHLHLSFFSWISHHSKRFQVSSHFFSVETHQLFTPSCNSNNKNSLSSSIRSSGYVYLKTIFKFLHLLCSLYFPQLVDFCLFQLFSFSFFFYICDGQT